MVDAPTSVQPLSLARDLSARALATLVDAIWNAPLPVSLYDRDLRLIRANPAMARLLGFAAADLPGRTIDQTAPQLAPVVRPALQRAVETGQAQMNVQVSGETAGLPGEHRHFLGNIYPFPCEQGGVGGLCAVVVEVTELRRREQQARDAQAAAEQSARQLNDALTAMRGAQCERERLVAQLQGALAERDASAALVNSLFTAAPLAMALLDRDLRFLRVNHAAATLSGLAPEDHLGRQIGELLPWLGEQVGSTLQTVLRTGELVVERPFSCETPAHPGQRRQFQGSFLPVRAREAIAAVGVVFREVTTATNAEIFQRHVLGIVGHDLRNPLSAMSSAVGYLLRADNLTDRQRSLLERALSSGGRMERIIRDLLDFTRLSVGNGVPISPRPTCLDEICRPLLGEMEAANPRRVIAYESSGDGRGVWDPDRLGQVVANLLTNAIKYAPLASPVMLRWSDTPDGVRLEVENYGPPIPTAMMPLLFEPFARAAAHPSRKPGIGLGLYIARQLVRAHGGTVECRSSTGATCFSVWLPREAPLPREGPPDDEPGSHFAPA